MKALLLLLAMVGTILGQGFTMRDVSFIGAAQVVSSGWGTVTNNTDGTLPYTWWVADDYATNGSTVSIPDRWTNNIALTNSDPTTRWPVKVANGLNSRAFIYPTPLSTATYIRNLAFSNTASNEVVVVLNVTNSTSVTWLFDGCFATNRHSALIYPANKWDLSASGTDQVYADATTNKWMVYNFVFNTANTRLYTNNTVGPVLNAGNSNHFGFLLFNAYNTNSASKIGNVAEIITYSTSLTEAQRNNVYQHLTNKYALTP